MSKHIFRTRQGIYGNLHVNGSPKNNHRPKHGCVIPQKYGNRKYSRRSRYFSTNIEVF